MPTTHDESGDFMDAIGEINAAVDEISDQVDTLIQ